MVKVRPGTITDSEVREDEVAEVILNDYSSQLRHATQCKSEFSIEYRIPVNISFSIKSVY